jgi:hypothetical protein
MQAPARPDEDTRSGFGRGGWAQAGNDQVMADFMGAGRALHRVADQAAEVRGRTDPGRAAAVAGLHPAARDAAGAVAALKQEPGPDLVVLGSGELIGSLRPRALRYHHDRRHHRALPDALTTDRVWTVTEQISAMRLMPADVAWCTIEMSGFTGIRSYASRG